MLFPTHRREEIVNICIYLYLYAYIHTFFFLLTGSGFAKLEAKTLPLTGGIIFLEIGFTEIISGCYYIQKTATIAYVISLFPVPSHTPACNIVGFIEIKVKSCCEETGHQNQE